MSAITNSTNVRVGPGVYAALKELSEKTGLSMGTCANLLLSIMMYSADKSLASYQPETQKALTADMFAAFSELFRISSLETVKNTSFADLYKDLLGQKKPDENK